MSIENQIVTATQIIAQSILDKAENDKTYTGVVEYAIDQTSGKYMINQGGSLIQAHSISADIKYRDGQYVLLHVPRNSWSNSITIIGPAEEPVAMNFTEIKPAKDKYNKLGPNALTMSVEQELCSYRDEIRRLVPGTDFTLSDNILKQYVSQGNGLALSAIMRTNLSSGQTGGDYGVVFNFIIKDDVSGKMSIVPYTVNSFNVIGNPYNLKKQTRVQNLITTIKPSNIVALDNIQVYVKNFPQDSTKTTPDIFISSLQINGCQLLTADELDGYLLYVDCEETGNILGKNQDDAHVIKLNATLKVKGKVCTDPNLQYYWFVDDAMIYLGGSGYTGEGGQGWRNINKNGIPEVVSYAYFGSSENRPSNVSSRYLYYNVTSKITKIKCVVKYDGHQIAGETEVINQAIQENMYIDSSDKEQGQSKNVTVYYMDNGNPTLTCVVQDYDLQSSHELIYRWGVFPSRSTGIKEITEEEKNLIVQAKALKHLASMMDDSSKEEFLNSDGHQQTIEAGQELANSEYIDGNVLYNYSISTIINRVKIICNVYDTYYDGTELIQIYKGNASIVLENKMEIADSYSLIIQNGNQVFQYDAKGNSPASEQLEKPIETKKLSYAVLDEQGHLIPHEQILNNGYVEWMIPNSDTLISTNEYIDQENNRRKITKSTLDAKGTDKALAAEYDIYKGNFPNFSFSIAPQYDSKKTKNYIRLDIKYNDLLLTAYTNFSFPKDGDPGTNGTDYVAKIVPKIQTGTKDIPVYSSVVTDRIYLNDDVIKNGEKNQKRPYDDNGKFIDKLEFQLYNNSQRVYQITDSQVYWTCPPKEDSSSNLKSLIRISPIVQGGKEILPQLVRDLNQVQQPIDIVRGKTTFRNLDYYAEIPVCYVHNEPNRHYRFKIRPKTGFSYVVYAQDGTSPDYDNTKPFQIIVEEFVEKYYITKSSGCLFKWRVIGNLKQVNGDFTESAFCFIAPLDKFNGDVLNSAVVVEVFLKPKNQEEEPIYVGLIHVPINMIINRFGHAAINGWDGNSIDLGNDNGGTILAPQMGAGYKDSNNRFTGILMGVEKNNQTITGTPGLYGYNRGERSIFLDATTGDATFGKQGAGQIKIDAESNEGTISSGDYDQENLSGMKIKFSSTKKLGQPESQMGPYIRYGSGKFSVSSEGELTAKGGGSIAGWKIGDDQLISQNEKVYLRSQNYDSQHPYSFYSNGTFSVTPDGFLTSQSGKIGGWQITPNKILARNVNGDDMVGMSSQTDPEKTDNIRFYAGGQPGRRKFYVTEQGYLRSTSGKIADWEIGDTALENGLVGMGTKTFGSGETQWGESVNARFWGKSQVNGLYNFAVSQNGKLYSTAGKIGGWDITSNSLYSERVDSNGKVGKIYISSDGSIRGGDYAFEKKQVNVTVVTGLNTNANDGKVTLETTKEKIEYQTGTGYSLDNDGTASFYNIIAPSGKIGNYLIKNGQISNGQLRLTADGSLIANRGYIGEIVINGKGIHGPGFHITGSSAQFTNLKVNSNGSVSSGGGGGSGFSNGSGFRVNPNSLNINPDTTFTGVDKDGKNQNLHQYVDGKFHNLLVTGTFTYGGHTVHWDTLDVMTGISATRNWKTFVTSINFDAKTYTITAGNVIGDLIPIRKKLYLLTTTDWAADKYNVTYTSANWSTPAPV